LVEHHIKADSKFAEALLREGIDASRAGHSRPYLCHRRQIYLPLMVTGQE
jgi:hypothetical protein